ncbi:DNA cytosine methyltransferase [Streptomyces sp. RFCAC02]|uniref:DNA cytosine methyltransferase n=1 Tax=Streptomyces sp. RFCAC02 TaxID=2499143 RepID=UPI00101FA6DE|nr:DNA cytosine methyltransferase [Streptomyces sp. RFCAC02]
MILDLFAGPGGWSHALRVLGRRDIGIEWDRWACRTRAAAGHLTVRTDAAVYPVRPFLGRTRGLIASPPCQAWSTAGRRLGLVDQPLVHQAIADLAAGRDTRARLLTACRDQRSLLAAEPMRYLHALNTVGEPEWAVMEEVPAVLALWRQYAATLRTWGFSVWAGILNAADFGAPQTRRRAILLASRTRTATPPPPTHARDAEPESLFGPGRRRWVSMAEALGWGATQRPVPTLCAGGGPGGGPEPFPSGSRKALADARDHGHWTNPPHATTRRADEPAGTLFFGHRSNACVWIPEHTSDPTGRGAIRITSAEAGVLQTFPADYPWQGNQSQRFTQIGNAVPPLLAAHLLAPHLNTTVTPGDFSLAA